MRMKVLSTEVLAATSLVALLDQEVSKLVNRSVKRDLSTTRSTYNGGYLR
jgi:hypothetical protein